MSEFPSGRGSGGWERLDTCSKQKLYRRFAVAIVDVFGIFLQARTMNRTKCGGAVISELVVSHRAMFRGPVGTSTEPRDWIPRFKGSSATWRWNREVMLPPSAIKVDNRQHEERVVDTE